MEYEEYMMSLTEQIHDKRARKLVEDEIRNHIEDQTEDYENSGMTRIDALREAVRQMGNPVETGIELNKIHRPKTPWGMLFLTSVLTLIAVMMQYIVFIQAGTPAMDRGSLSKTLFYNGIGFVVILGMLYLDYNILVRYAYVLYVLYLLLLSVCVVFVAHATLLYGIWMLYPIIFSGILYQNRNQGIKGLLRTLLLGINGVFLYGAICLISGSNVRSVAAVVETVIIIFLLAGAAIRKGIFGSGRKQCAVLYGACAGVCGFFAITFMFITKSDGYLQSRFLNLLAPSAEREGSYLSMALRESIADATLTGKRSFFLGRAMTENYSDFLLNSMFTYWGKLVGVVVLLLLVVFLGKAFQISLRQKNRIGFLVGMACSLGILVRLLVYVGINFGYGIWWTTLVPFLSYGIVSAVMNGIYVGLILCVHRNSNILKEDGRPRLVLSVSLKRFC